MSAQPYDPACAPPYEPEHEPDTPVTAEDKLATFQDELDKAREALRDKRDAEVAAKLEWNEAKRAARFRPDCPKAGVFDGVRVTVADKEAWIAALAQPEERAYELARAARQAASDHLYTLGKQGGFQQSITASVREAYRGTGRQSWP